MATNIYQRMSAITAEISAVAKNLRVGEGRNSYKAVGEADVLAAVKPAEEKHGIYSYPQSREIVESTIITNSKKYNGETYETKQQFLRIQTVYRFVNVDEPGEYVDITAYGDGVDPQDKAPGKAMTYADKYALLKAYKIVTGDDPDQKASAPLKDKPQMASKAQIDALKKLGADNPEHAEYIRSKVSSWSSLTDKDASEILKHLEGGSDE